MSLNLMLYTLSLVILNVQYPTYGYPVIVDLIDRILTESNGLEGIEDPFTEFKRESVVRREAGEEGDHNLPTLVKHGLQEKPLMIGAFNIQTFGDTKYGKKDIVNHIIKILLRYDLILVQEIKDKDGSSFIGLMEDLNKQAEENGYVYALSERLGRTSSKEQYAYIYKSERLQLITTYIYRDTGDVFMREPYIAKFKSLKTGLAEFGVIGCHTRPADAVKEIDALVDVHQEAVTKLDTQNIIIMGDLNADCSYVAKFQWSSIRLNTDSQYTWLIPTDYDTTITNSHCAYDRIIITGDELKKNYIQQSAKAFNFMHEFGLSQEEATDVSDHYPIEMALYGKVDSEVQHSVTTAHCITFESKTPVDDLGLADLGFLLSVEDPADAAGFNIDVLSSGNFVKFITASKTLPLTDAPGALRYFQNQFPMILSDYVTSVAEAYLNDAGVLNEFDVLPGFEESSSPDVKISIVYNYEYLTYKVTMSRNVA